MKRVINFLRSIFTVSPENQLKIETCDCKNCTCNRTEAYKGKDDFSESEKIEKIPMPSLKVENPILEVSKEETISDIPKSEKKKPRRRYYKKKTEEIKKEGASKKKNQRSKDV